MSRSVHDNFITGYEVDCESTTIAIHTEHRDHGQPFERTDVFFEGVVGYFFRDNLTGILFAIEDSTIDEILVEYAEDFRCGARHGWPGMWNTPDNDPSDYLNSADVRVWRLRSSTCFEGFVIARAMTVQAA